MNTADLQWDALAKSLCFADEKAMWVGFYLEERLSVLQIAERLKSGTATINRRMHLCGIEKRPRGGGRSTAKKRLFLWYLDQRVVMHFPTQHLADVYGFSYAIVYQYKRWKAGYHV